MSRKAASRSSAPDTPAAFAVVLGCFLAATAGGVDLLCLARLGQVFASIITGNVVVVGEAIGAATWPRLVHGAVAVAGYAVGVALGSALTRRAATRKTPWPRHTAELIGCEMVTLILLAAVWIASGGAPAGSWQYVALATAAIAMGLQSAAFRLVGLKGVTTTYFTGTLTDLLAGVIQRGRFNLSAVGALAALLAGATATALLVRINGRLSVLLPALLCLIAGVIAVAAMRQSATPTARLGTPRKATS